MPSKKVFLAGYDDGHGFKVVDPATGALLRQVQGSWWTDNIEGLYTEGNHLWALDRDSSLVRADLDGVVKTKVDIGYYGNQDTSNDEFWAMYVLGDFIYHLHRVDTGNPNPGGGLVQGDPQPTDNNLYYLVKRNKTTLAVVSETKLDHANLGDSGLNVNYLGYRVWNWQADGFWVLCDGGPKSNFFIKVGFDGLPTGAEIDATAQGGWFNNNQKFWQGPTTLVYLNLSYTGDWGTSHSISQGESYVFDFAGAGSVTVIAPWGPIPTTYALQNLGSVVDATRKYPRVSGNVISFPIKYSGYSWSGGPHDGLTDAWGQLTLDFTDGTALVESDPVWLNVWDMPSNINFANNSECSAPYDADRFFMIDERKGIWLVNFTTGVVDYTTGFNFQQGYSGDATEIDSGMMVTIPYYVLSGTVTDDGAPVVGRSVRVYDQETGTYIGSAVTNGSGVYSMTVFTTTKKFAVCPSTDGTKNFKVNAHLTPA